MEEQLEEEVVETPSVEEQEATPSQGDSLETQEVSEE